MVRCDVVRRGVMWWCDVVRGEGEVSEGEVSESEGWGKGTEWQF